MTRHRRTLFLVDGSIACLLGAGLLLFPDQLLLFLGVRVGGAASILARLLGAAEALAHNWAVELQHRIESRFAARRVWLSGHGRTPPRQKRALR